MPVVSRLLVAPALVTLLAGCAAVNTGPPTLAELSIAEGYYAVSSEAAPLQPAALEHCWSWLDDSLLGQIVEPPEPGVAQPPPENRAEIAGLYARLRARQAEIENARAYLAAQQDNLEIARFREQAGLVTTRDAVQADAERARVAASLPRLEADIAEASGRIAVLAGQAPAALRDVLAVPGPIPIEPAEVALGSPADLLRQRADLREAAVRLRTASLLGDPSGKARAAYRRSVLDAVERVERTRAAFDGSVARARALSDAVEKAEALTTLVRRQYRDGLADYAALSAAETGLLGARDALAVARAERAAASIDLCVALGGGRPAPVVEIARTTPAGG